VILLWKLLGFKLTAFYVIAMFIFAVLAGVTFNGLKLEKHLRNVRIRSSQNGVGQKESKWIIALKDTWNFLYPVLPYLVIVVLIVAILLYFIPSEFIIIISCNEYLYIFTFFYII